MCNKGTCRGGSAFFVCLLVLATLFLSMRVVAGTESTATGEDTLIAAVEKLASQDAMTRDGAVNEILAQRKALVERLIGHVDPANSGAYSYDTQAAAAYVLGELRAPDAVPVLAKALAQIPTPKASDDISRYDNPFWNALVKIGRPSVPAMIENIESTNDERLRYDSITALIHVLGGSRHTDELLEKLKARSVDAEKTKRIEKAMAWIEKYFGEGEGKQPLY